ncbi:MAG: hypothetical protein ACJ8C4_09900 [Gemmataceae bacterium]
MTRKANHPAQKSDKAVPATNQNAPGDNGEKTNAKANPPRGLDAERHAAAQKRAQQADILRKGVFAALMADALAIDPSFEVGAYRIYLQQLIADAGNPTDPVEVMLLEQLALSHFRIGQLQVLANTCKSIESTKILTAAASRLLGEFRRTALGLKSYRTESPKRQVPASPNLKLFKMAQ